MAPIKHWLDELEDLFRLLDASVGAPICFLIGAGASLSSNAPTTASVVAALMEARPGMFPDPAAVYAKVHQLSTDDRSAITSRLFSGIVPHVGYRCLAAMARARPIIVVNLNWDECPIDACLRLGIPAEWVEAVHLADTEDVAAALQRLEGRGKGLLSVHVHGRLEDPGERDPRFGTKETLKFNEREFEQLQLLLSFHTYVIGTSLSGPHDVTELVKAMRAPEGLKESRVKRIWVIERGPIAQVPNPLTEAGHDLTRVLEDRRSTSNFLAAPDVDFDMFMVALRAAEVHYTWEDVRKEADAALPARSELVPPSPAVVRPLLDAPGLLVGRPSVGKWAVAHQVAHWLSILEDPPRRLRSIKGGRAIATAMEQSRGEDPPGVLVGGSCFGSDSYRDCSELLEEVESGDQASGLILVSRPSQWSEALEKGHPSLEQSIRAIPFQASQVWERRALKAYARRLSPQGAMNIEEAIERGELTTPQHVDWANEGRPVSGDPQEPAQLIAYLARLRERDEESALALALIRLQDLMHAVPRGQIEECCETKLDKLVCDPWELVTVIRIDDEYLCLARREVIMPIDTWMSSERSWLAERIDALGERFRWAREGLARWERLQEFDPKAHSLADFDQETIELIGPELIEPALGISAKKAMRVLEVMLEEAPDAWAVREVAFELVRRWGSLRKCPKARQMRDELIADSSRHGLYALFEGLLRHGGVGALGLWHQVLAALTEMSCRLDEDENRRQVALCFDALLWRRAPADEQQRRMLFEQLLEAAEEDELLRAAFAAAAAYHWDGAEQLAAFELPNPVEELGHVSEAAALEMRWVVEWHFVNQSRNRALASRRYFRSTRVTPALPDQPRLLSRKPLKRSLGKDASNAVIRVVAQLGRFKSTAGWGILMIANVHSTFGRFHVKDLGKLISKAKIDDFGLVWSAVTYESERRLEQEVRNALTGPEGRDAIQRALAGELEVDRTPIRRPRFLTSPDPWREVWLRMGMDSEVLEDLSLPENEPWRLVEVARDVRDSVVAKLGDEEAVDEVIEQLAATDLRLIERVHSQEGFAERARRKQGTKSEVPDIRERVYSLIYMAAGILSIEREGR